MIANSSSHIKTDSVSSSDNDSDVEKDLVPNMSGTILS